MCRIKMVAEFRYCDKMKNSMMFPPQFANVDAARLWAQTCPNITIYEVIDEEEDDARLLDLVCVLLQSSKDFLVLFVYLRNKAGSLRR
jgi:hypothetical protein